MSHRGSRYHELIPSRTWARVRRAVFDRDGWRCVRCGGPGALECDHVVAMHVDPGQDPVALDGLQTLCRGCHIAKTRAESERPDPARAAWRALIEDML